jgi:hypothetical protein
LLSFQQDIVGTTCHQVKRLNNRKVRTLIGHQQLKTGLRCLPSLSKFSAEPVTLFIHDDGTLNEEDCERLLMALPGAVIVRRNEADTYVEPLLARYPKCREYRQQHPLGLKLIDMALFEKEVLAYCDSDVLFLKPYAGLFQWPEDHHMAAIFMQDIQNAYSLHPWHIYPFGKIRVPQKINSGLILFRTSMYDLDFIEWLLGQRRLQSVFKKRAHWIEQTCWAALGWRVGSYVWSASQFMIATPNMTGLSEETVGIHFVAACRGKLQDFPQSEENDRKAAIPIEIRPTKLSSAGLMLMQDIRKRF